MKSIFAAIYVFAIIFGSVAFAEGDDSSDEQYYEEDHHSSDKQNLNEDCTVTIKYTNTNCLKLGSCKTVTKKVSKVDSGFACQNAEAAEGGQGDPKLFNKIKSCDVFCHSDQ